MLREGSPSLTCHVSCVTCQMEFVNCDFFCWNFLYNFFYWMVKLVGTIEGLLSRGPTPSSFFDLHIPTFGCSLSCLGLPWQLVQMMQKLAAKHFLHLNCCCQNNKNMMMANITLSEISGSGSGSGSGSESGWPPSPFHLDPLLELCLFGAFRSQLGRVSAPALQFSAV